MFFFDSLSLIVIGITLLLTLSASAAVHAAFAKYRQVPTRRGLTGAQVARTILQAHGIHDVTVEQVAGNLTDHYDPRSKALRLSEPIYGSSSVAAVGIAAHEVGHAIQHAHGYVPLKFRSAWVPVAGIGTNLGLILVIVAAVMGGARHAPGMTWLALAVFATATVFTLITLPVEFDASRRAKITLEQGGVLTADEMPGVRRVLGAAALTYVAAFLVSLMHLIEWMIRLGVFGRRED